MADNTKVPVSTYDFKLDTGCFNDFITHSKNLAQQLSDLKSTIDGAKDVLMFSWAGEGRNMFEKKYYMLSIKLGDVANNLYDMADELIEWEQQYIDQDMASAKARDGKTKRY